MKKKCDKQGRLGIENLASHFRNIDSMGSNLKPHNPGTRKNGLGGRRGHFKIQKPKTYRIERVFVKIVYMDPTVIILAVVAVNS